MEATLYFNIGTALQLNPYSNLFNLYKTLTTTNGKVLPISGSDPFLVDKDCNPLERIEGAMELREPDEAWPHDPKEELERIGIMLAQGRYSRTVVTHLEKQALLLAGMVAQLIAINSQEIAVSSLAAISLEELDALRARRVRNFP